MMALPSKNAANRPVAPDGQSLVETRHDRPVEVLGHDQVKGRAAPLPVNRNLHARGGAVWPLPHDFCRRDGRARPLLSRQGHDRGDDLSIIRLISHVETVVLEVNRIRKHLRRSAQREIDPGQRQRRLRNAGPLEFLRHLACEFRKFPFREKRLQSDLFKLRNRGRNFRRIVNGQVTGRNSQLCHLAPVTYVSLRPATNCRSGLR